VATHTETRSTEREREATESSAPDGAQTEKTIEPAIALPPVAVRLSLCPSARSLLRRSSASFALLSLLPSFSFCLCLSLLQRSLRLSRSSLRRPCSLRQPWAPYKVRLLPRPSRRPFAGLARPCWLFARPPRATVLSCAAALASWRAHRPSLGLQCLSPALSRAPPASARPSLLLRFAPYLASFLAPGFSRSPLV